MAKKFLSDPFYCNVHVAHAHLLEAVVGVSNELIDLSFVVNDPGLEIGEVEVFCALSLWEDEVEEEEEAEPGVEWEPAYDEEGPRFSEQG